MRMSAPHWRLGAKRREGSAGWGASGIGGGGAPVAVSPTGGNAVSGSRWPHPLSDGWICKHFLFVWNLGRDSEGQPLYFAFRRKSLYGRKGVAFCHGSPCRSSACFYDLFNFDVISVTDITSHCWNDPLSTFLQDNTRTSLFFSKIMCTLSCKIIPFKKIKNKKKGTIMGQYYAHR